uniref:RNase H type-1 domain-containing protein n=1 Tax=Cannabis sativa TaxID=3483 RepID=A0A803PAD2_CANSA
MWKWCNDMIHKERRCSLEDIYGDCMRRYSEVQSTHYSACVDIPSELGGEKPHQHMHFGGCCFRVDASVVEEQVDFAAVCISRSHSEELASAALLEDHLFAVKTGKVHSVMEGELQGINLALQMAVEYGAEMVRIETDSMAEANAFQAGCMPFCWDVYPLFYECLRLCKSFRKFEVLYIPREENLVADKLAQWARINCMDCKGRIGDIAPSLCSGLR